MRTRKSHRAAISSNLLTGAVVGGFVGIVVIALIWTSILPGPPQGTLLTFGEIALFGGSPSSHSLNSTCQGGAQLEVDIQNPTNENITVQSIVVHGSGVTNATAFLVVSSSCLSVAETSPLIESGGELTLEGYVNAPIRYLSTYVCYMKFSSGQILNQTVVAQS